MQTEEAKIAGLPITLVSEASPYMTVLIYGIPGAGKTRLAATTEDVPDLRPILYIDIEGGTESIRELYPNIQVVRVKSVYDKGGRLKKSAWEQLKELYEALKKGEGGYATVIVDNVTEAYQHAIVDVLADMAIERPDRDPDTPSQLEYGKATSKMRKWLRDMRNLDCNIIMTAHEVAKENDSGQVQRYAPSLPGKLAMEIPGNFDMVLYLYAKQDSDKKVTRRVQTDNVGKYIAKVRSSKPVPLVISEPTMKMLYDIKKGL